MKAVRLGGMDDVLRVLRPLLRWRYVILTVVAFLSCFQHLRGTGVDWRYFVEGSELIFGQHRLSTPYPGGLHFYANYPDFQIGPLSLALAAPIRILGGSASRVVGAMVMTAMVPVLIYVLERSSRRVFPAIDERDEEVRKLTVLFGGLMIAVAWAPLATIYAHFDDVVTITTCVVAIWAVASHRPVWAGIAIGAAIGAKPWGVVALPLAFAFVGRDRRKAVAVAIGVAALAWGPFMVGDPATLHAAQPQVVVSAASVPHLFGLPVNEAPTWLRALQLFCAPLVGIVAVLRGRWDGALLVAIATRIALDPQEILYYDTGFIVAALAWDLLRARRALPIASLFTFVFLNTARTIFHDPTPRAVMRLVLTLALIAAVLFSPYGRPVVRQDVAQSAT